MAPVDYKAMTAALKRCEHYLGLGPDGDTTTQTGPDTEPVVLIAVDAEADEKGRITEIGLAVLDTKEVIGKEPGRNGKNWMDAVRSSHFRILGEDGEYGDWSCKNKWAGGNPAAYTLGISKEVTMKHAREIIRAQFEGPYIKSFAGKAVGHTRRRLVFVGQDYRNEVKFLSQIDFNPLHHPRVFDAIDTQHLDLAVRRAPTVSNMSQPRNLRKILEEQLSVDMTGQHNAGMDAYFTMQALIGLTVKSAHTGIAREDDDTWGTNDNGGSGIVPKKTLMEYSAYYAYQ